MITQRFQLPALPSTAQVKSQDDSEGQGPVVLSDSGKWHERKRGRKSSSVGSE
ncbi:hypothetical protein Nmel_013450 [Mimus melanotis]